MPTFWFLLTWVLGRSQTVEYIWATVVPFHWAVSECNNCTDLKVTLNDQRTSDSLDFVGLLGELCQGGWVSRASFFGIGTRVTIVPDTQEFAFFCYTAGFVSKECMLIILLFVNCDKAKYIRVWCRYWWQRVGIKETWGKEFVGGWRKNEVQWISLALAGRRKGI